MTTGVHPLYSRCHESTPTGHPVSPTTLEVDFGRSYCVDEPQELPFLIHSTTETTIVRRHEIQQGAAAVSFDAVTNSDYVVTLGRIEALRLEEDEEDRPSDEAYDGAMKLLSQAARDLSLKFPRASASVGPNRGLRVTWSCGRREVRLVLGGSAVNRSYIYSECGSDHRVDYFVDGSHLAQHLRWAMREA